MKAVVTGDRHWTDEAAIERVFEREKVTHVIEGECQGLDLLARKVCERKNIPFSPFQAEWEKYGRLAGPLRNANMLDQNPDVVLAFHDDLYGKSKGTRDCALRAMERGFTVKLVTHAQVQEPGRDPLVVIRVLTPRDHRMLRRR